MGAQTSIAWTDCTWNPVRGCSRVSEGCRNCYAERQSARFSDPGQPFHGFASRRVGRAFGTSWTGKVELVESKLREPLSWRKPRRVFVNSMSDLFHEALPDEAIDRVFAVMACAGRQRFQVLTKRAKRMAEYMAKRAKSAQPWKDAARTVGYSLEFEGLSLVRWPLPNVWLGVSVEDQATADARIPFLLHTPAAIRFISAEPLLEAVDLMVWENKGHDLPSIDWVIGGGESGYGARPCDVAWLRSLRDQCEAAGVAFFCKQLGAWPVKCNLREMPPSIVADFFNDRGSEEDLVAIGNAAYPRVPLRDAKGADPSEWPEDLRVQEFPEAIA